MATSASTRTGGHVGYEDARHRDRGRTPAQWYCTLGGLALLLAGIAGFFFDSSFDTGGNIDGDAFLGFEVNGFHNIVHILSGLLLLAAAGKRASAKIVALVFGLTYGLVALIGLVDGETVFGLIPVNPADNVLHIALSAVGILAAIASDKDDDDHRGTGDADRERFTTGRRIESHDAVTGSGHDVDPLTGRPRTEQINR
jgi:hypothetical protein